MDGDIVINNPNNVMIGGENAGAIADVLKNIPERASDVQRAMADYWTAEQKAKLDVANEHKAEVDALKAEKDALASDLATVTAERDEMAGHPDVIASQKEKAAAKARADIAAAEATKAQAEKTLADLGVSAEVDPV